MATFKVGDKVRIKKTAKFEPAARCFLGAEAVIVGDGLGEIDCDARALLARMEGK